MRCYKTIGSIYYFNVISFNCLPFLNHINFQNFTSFGNVRDVRIQDQQSYNPCNLTENHQSDLSGDHLHTLYLLIDFG